MTETPRNEPPFRKTHPPGTEADGQPVTESNLNLRGHAQGAAIRRAATHRACRHRSRAKHGSCAIISGPCSRCENLYGCVLYREVWLAMADLTVPPLAAGAVVVGALAGQVSTIVGTVITGRRDRTTAQEKRRREAYAAFIDATQGILQAPDLRKRLSCVPGDLGFFRADCA